MSLPWQSGAKNGISSDNDTAEETLGTKEWWNKYYVQSHHQYWDWYLQNKQVIQFVEKAIKGEFNPIHMNNNLDDNNNNNTTESVKKSDISILQTGCGSSQLSIQLYELGYHHIENIDFSFPVIESMMKLHPTDKYPGLNYKHMDARSLQYSDNSFNVILDKGTLDCVVLDKSDRYSGYKYLNEVYRCLKIGGVFLCFSLFSYHERIKYFEMGTENIQENNSNSNNENNNNFRPLNWRIQYKALDCSPLELPNQQHTHCFICVKQAQTNSID